MKTAAGSLFYVVRPVIARDACVRAHQHATSRHSR